MPEAAPARVWAGFCVAACGVFCAKSGGGATGFDALLRAGWAGWADSGKAGAGGVTAFACAAGLDKGAAGTVGDMVDGMVAGLVGGVADFAGAEAAEAAALPLRIKSAPKRCACGEGW